MKSYFLPLLAVLCVVAAVGWTYSVQPIHQPTLPSAPPPESPASGGVAGVGLVEPESENVQISCAVSGIVTGLYVKAGDRVSKGQRLFSLDDRELTADLGVKKAAVAGAEARLMKLEDEPRPEEIPTAEAKVTPAIPPCHDHLQGSPASQRMPIGTCKLPDDVEAWSAGSGRDG